LFIGCISAQILQGSYMSAPPGRVSGAPTSSQVGPCGEGNDSLPIQKSAGSLLDVSWVKNNINSNNLVYLLLLEYPGMQVYRSLRNYTFNTLSASVRIPPDTPTGFYYLQWVYDTYYTCAVLNISASTVQTLIVSQQVTKAVPISDYDYYEITVDAQYNDQFLEFYGSGPNGVNTGAYISVVGNENPNFLPYPTLSVYDNIADTTTTDTFYFSLCRDNNQEDEFTVGVFGSPAVAPSTPYTLTVGAYPPTVNALQALASDAHNGKKYFLTQAYTTEIKRRFVVEYSQAFVDIPQVRLARNCDFNNQVQTAVQTTTKSMCMDLPDTQGRKYIEVPPTTFTYTVKVEEGTCQEVADSSSTIFASLALIASLVFALLM